MSFRGLIYWFSKPLSRTAQLDWKRIKYWANLYQQQKEQRQ